MTERTVEDALRTVEEKCRGRTYYEGREPRDDELMRAEILRLRAIVDKLPKTADGVLVEQGDTVWKRRRLRGGYAGQTVGADMYLQEYEVLEHCPRCECAGELPSVRFNEVGACYSTREAAERAAREKQ